MCQETRTAVNEGGMSRCCVDLHAKFARFSSMLRFEFQHLAKRGMGASNFIAGIVGGNIINMDGLELWFPMSFFF